MEIVACLDHNFVMPTGVMMKSVCVNNENGEVNFHLIVDSSFTEGDKRIIQDIADSANNHVSVYTIDEEFFTNMPGLGWRSDITKATFYRLWLAKILPETLDKVIYLDGDIIVRGSLKPIWEENVWDYAVGAVLYIVKPEAECLRLGYSKELGYFNAGVMVVNLKYWRENNVVQEFDSFIKNYYDRVIWQDQDVLNYVFAGKVLWLPIEYNIVAGFLCKCGENDIVCQESFKKALENPVVIHYSMGKPWYKGNRHPFRSSFFKYRAQTIWKDEPLQERRPWSLRIKKAIGGILRKFHIIPELPPYGKGYISGLSPLD